MGFALGCLVFTAMGSLVLAIDPSARLSGINLASFVTGAFFGIILLSLFYPTSLEGLSGELRFALVLLTIALAGRAFVLIAQKFGPGD